MYKEIEDVLREAMNMQSTQNYMNEDIITDQCDNLKPDPLQGIEEGLELVNSILTNTLGNRDENDKVSPSSPMNVSTTSDLAKYLNFQSQSHNNVHYSLESDVYNENFNNYKGDSDPKKPIEGLKSSKSGLTPFLERTEKSVMDDSETQLMSSPVIKHQNHPMYEELDQGDNSKANIFTPKKGENKENIEEKINISQKPISKVIP